VKLYTIGFTQRTARSFFDSLRSRGVWTLIDIRINPHGQLAGFAKQADLPYFLDALADGCRYTHLPLLAPTKEILKDYRRDHDWARYEARFEALMDERNVPAALEPALFADQVVCLLCSEARPEKCHRRLVAERLAANWPGVEVIHL